MELFTQLEQKYKLPPGILKAQMMQESGGRMDAVSPKGAQGPFQFMPATAKELGINPLVLEEAAEGAAQYLRKNIDNFGSTELGLAAYNAGPGNVKKHGGIPPFKETQNYVKSIMANISEPEAPNKTSIYEVEGPDGNIYEIEAPSDAAEDDILSFLNKQNASPEQKDTPNEISRGGAAYAGLAKGIPFGADLVSQALGKISGVPAADIKNEINSAYEYGTENYPLTTYGAMGAGVVGTGLMTPAKLAQAPSVLGRAMKGGLLAGSYGAAYGAGEGDTLDDRASRAYSGFAAAAPYGVGGSIAFDAAGAALRPVARAVGNRVGPLAQKAQRYISKFRDRPAPDNYTPPAGVMTAPNLGPDDLPTVPGGAISLTKGQATQVPRQQALEYGALAGNYGDDAQRLALETREVQSDQAKKILQEFGAGDDGTYNAAANIYKDIKAKYQSAKAKTDAAYRKVGDLGSESSLFIGADYIKKTMVPSIKDWARNGGSGTGFDLSAPGMENAKRLYNQAADIAKMDKITSMNFQRLEHWRGRISQGIANSKTKAERAFLSGMLQRYDDAITALPKEAIKNGDEAIIMAMEKARKARSTQGALFERNKYVADILENEAITSEQLANTLFRVKSSGFADDAAPMVDGLLKAAGDQAPVIKDELRRGVISKILKSSLASEIKQGTTESMLSFDKLATQLGKYLDNKSLVQKLHTPEEIKVLRSLYDDARLVKSAKPGTRNYSNTAYTLLNYLRKISPTLEKANFMGYGPGSILKSMGEGSATLEAQRAFSSVVGQAADEMAGLPFIFAEKYGPQVLSVAAGKYGQEKSGAFYAVDTQQDTYTDPETGETFPMVTVRPSN